MCVLLAIKSLGGFGSPREGFPLAASSISGTSDFAFPGPIPDSIRPSAQIGDRISAFHRFGTYSTNGPSRVFTLFAGGDEPVIASTPPAERRLIDGSAGDR